MASSETQTPVVQAASEGNLEQLQGLIAAEGPPDEKTVHQLLAAATWKSQSSIVEYLLTKYPPTSIEEETVRAAIYSRSIPLFSRILSHDPSIINMQFDKRGTPIIVACISKQSPEFLKFMLEAGADPNQDPDAATLTPLEFVAAFYKDTEAVDLLLKHGATLEGSRAATIAKHRNNQDMERYLVEKGVTYRDDDN